MNAFKIIISAILIFNGFANFANIIKAEDFSASSSNKSKIYSETQSENLLNDLTSLSKDSFYPGIIRIKFNTSMEKDLDGEVLKAIDNSYVKTGINALDNLNKTYRVYEYQPLMKEIYKLSPASLKYKERHKEWKFHLWYDLKICKNENIIEAINDFTKLEEVKIAEPVLKKRLIEPVNINYIDKIEKNHSGSKKWTPNDPYFEPYQWNLKNTGQSIQGQEGVEGWDCNASAAWEIEKGDTNVVVAVKDSGVDFEHEDLKGNMFFDIGPQGKDTEPDAHGTHVSGIIAAITNNNLGIAGLAGGSGSDDGVRIMSIDLINAVSTPAAFTYAADNGAAISQNSWTYGPLMPTYAKTWIDYYNEEGGGEALDGGITIFAAGNDNTNIPSYPAAYRGTIAVASHDNRGQKSDFSNYGNWVDITAPGTFIYSLVLQNGYSLSSGTSMSCPHVSATAALIISNAYGELTNKQLETILLNSARTDIYNINPDYKNMLGAGTLDTYAALKLLNNNTYTVTFNIKDQYGNEVNDAVVTFNNRENPPGDYVFEFIKAGTYSYKVEADSYKKASGEVEVNDDIKITVILSSDGTFIGNPGSCIDISVFPNPARENFNIKSSETIKKVRLINISGQVIKTININALKSEISVSTLKPGVYFLEIHTGQNIINKRIKITP